MPFLGKLWEAMSFFSRSKRDAFIINKKMSVLLKLQEQAYYRKGPTT